MYPIALFSWQSALVTDLPHHQLVNYFKLLHHKKRVWWEISFFLFSFLLLVLYHPSSLLLPLPYLYLFISWLPRAWLLSGDLDGFEWLLTDSIFDVSSYRTRTCWCCVHGQVRCWGWWWEMQRETGGCKKNERPPCGFHCRSWLRWLQKGRFFFSFFSWLSSFFLYLFLFLSFSSLLRPDNSKI